MTQHAKVVPKADVPGGPASQSQGVRIDIEEFAMDVRNRSGAVVALLSTIIAAVVLLSASVTMTDGATAAGSSVAVTAPVHAPLPPDPCRFC